MPIYAFACPSCGSVEERISRMGEEGESLVCSACGHSGMTKDRSSYMFAAHGLPNGHIAVGQHFASQKGGTTATAEKSEGASESAGGGCGPGCACHSSPTPN